MTTEPFRLVGVVHLPPLPTAGNYTGQPVGAIAELAACDAEELARAGFTDVMIQDANDRPQRRVVDRETLAIMARVGSEVASATDVGIGVTLGHNDGPGAMAVAAAIGASFIRVKVLTGAAVGPTGIIEGCAVETAAVRRRLDTGIEIWADVHEATSLTLAGDLGWAGQQAVKFGGADRLIVTRDSGVDDAIDDIERLRNVLPRTPLLIGGRVTVATAAEVRSATDGAIIGGAIKTGSGVTARIDPGRARELADAVGEG